VVNDQFPMRGKLRCLRVITRGKRRWPSQRKTLLEPSFPSSLSGLKLAMRRTMPVLSNT